jgi:hypothetical protein
VSHDAVVHPARTPAPSTVIGNPRTVDVCSGLDQDALGGLGTIDSFGPTLPVNCDFYLTDPRGAQYEVIAWVSGVFPAQGVSKTFRSVADQLVYEYEPSRTDCWSEVTGLDATITVEVVPSDDGEMDFGCRVRDVVADEVAASMGGHKFGHRSYAAESLTALAMCDYVQPVPPLTPRIATGLQVQDGPDGFQFGNVCGLDNPSLRIDVRVGVVPDDQPPAHRLTYAGHPMVQFTDTSNDARECWVDSLQAHVPDEDLQEELTVHASLRSGASLSADDLCGGIAEPLLAAVLDHMGRR